ncbi:hypothetical protein EWM64_g4331 [Hericium alpestre]|uniref:Xylanolytic transcriptional activator regulatory domain-containing protein n=1 Tax=Hericium alpestre TaxID=135208 RepID=A0A4Y9ZY06_9AGAM|nr:hypothetical protein EWM64_g4331 [Hericium alpestre]
MPVLSAKRMCGAMSECLATGQGTRFVIAATEHLHRRIARMSDRIRQLEDALAVLQSSHSKEQHPLLRECFVVDDKTDGDTATETEDGDTPADQVVNAFGTMSISEHGVSRFFGPTGGSEGLLLCDGEDATASPASSHFTDSTRGSGSPAVPAEVQRFSRAFPFTPFGPIEEVFAMIRSHLPPYEEAVRIGELMDEMLPIMYSKAPAQPPDDYSGPHDLALLLYVLAIGRIVDLDLSPTEAEAEGEHYNQLAKAALCLHPVLEKPSMITVQALHVGSIYNAMCGSEASGGESTMETTWSLVALAAHLAQSIGLHRDSARWELSPKVVQRRRMLFWDLFVADSWHTLSTGRPPSFNRAYVDCQYPQDDEMTMNTEGETEPGFGSWGFRFAFECVAEIATRTLTATPPRYSDIIELDRKVREFAIPSDVIAQLTGAPGTDPRDIPLCASMINFVLGHTREVMLLFIHRSYFAQALTEDPVNPLRSPYAPSFLATVRAASDVLRVVRAQFAIHPVMCSRFWATWTYAFSAAVVFGVIVTRGPRSHLAENAMEELDRACELFGQAGKYNRRAAKARLILVRLQDKAHHAFIAGKSAAASVSADDGTSWSIKQEELDDELDIFAGRTRVLRQPASSSHPSPTSRSDAPFPASQPQELDFTSSPALQPPYTVRSTLPPNIAMTSEWVSQIQQPVQYQQSFQQPSTSSRYGAGTLPPLPNEPDQQGRDFARQSQPQYASFPPAAEPPPIAPLQMQQQYPYPMQQQPAGGYQYGGYALPPDLAGLGLAPGSVLNNENWASLMQRSGILDGHNM